MSTRAQGVLDALKREESRDPAEPWLTPASIRVLAERTLRLEAALDEIANPRRSEWSPGEYPLVIQRMQEIARDALDSAGG